MSKRSTIRRSADVRRPWALWVLTALAVVSVAAVSIDLATSDGGLATSRRLFPSFDADGVESIRWTEGDDELIVEREGDHFMIVAPRRGRARDAAIEAFLGAVEMVEPMRRMKDGGPESLRSVEIRSGNERLNFEVRSGDDGWLSYGGSQYRIPSYLARELDVDAEDLRARRPFAALGDADSTGFAIGGASESTIVEGPPWQVLHDAPKGRLFADPDAVATVARLLRGVSYSSFSADVDPDAPTTFYIRARVLGQWRELVGVGDCAGGYLVSSDVGTGCVERRLIDSVLELGERAGRLLDRHLVVPGRHGKVDGVRIVRGSGELVLRSGAGWTAEGKTLDPQQVLAWLRRLDDLIVGEPVPVPENLGAASAVVELELASAERFVLEFYDLGGRAFVRRAQEPALWPVSPEIETVVRPDVGAFSGMELIPYSSAELTRAVLRRDGAVVDEVVRGELLGDWTTPRPGQRVRPDAVRALSLIHI